MTSDTQAQNRWAAVCPRRDRCGWLPSHREHPADLPPLEAAVWRHAGRGRKAIDSVEIGEGAPQEASGKGRAGEGDAQGPCCAVRRTVRCDGKRLSPERRTRPVEALLAMLRLRIRPQGYRPAPQHPTPRGQGHRNRGGQAQASSPPDRFVPQPPGATDDAACSGRKGGW